MYHKVQRKTERDRGRERQRTGVGVGEKSRSRSPDGTEDGGEPNLAPPIAMRIELFENISQTNKKLPSNE
eukprot:gene8320-5831_t